MFDKNVYKMALSPVSSSICCTHVRQGRPRWRFHSGLMSGLTPVRASTARRSAEWAGVASGSRCTWPKIESRLRQIRIAKPSSPLMCWHVKSECIAGCSRLANNAEADIHAPIPPPITNISTIFFHWSWFDFDPIWHKINRRDPRNVADLS